MPLNDPLNISQTDSSSLEFINAMQAFKDTEELVGVLHIKTDTVIAHEDDRFPFVTGQTANRDFRLFSRLGEFQSIRNQIDQHNSQHGAIRANYGELRKLPANASVLCLGLEVPDDLLNQLAQIHLRLDHLKSPRA